MAAGRNGLRLFRGMTKVRVARGMVCLFAMASAFAMTGCVSRDFIEIFDFPGEVWPAEKSVVFEFQPIRGIERGGEKGDESEVSEDNNDGGNEGEWMDIVVRHREDFPYANLTLEVKGIRPDRAFWIDTVSIRLAERDSENQYRWMGRHYSNHYEISGRYRNYIKYPDQGEYAVVLRQLSGEEELRGILSVGIVAGGCVAIGLGEGLGERPKEGPKGME